MTRNLPLPVAFIYHLIATCWRVYGPWAFISSIVIGIFLSWALYIKMLPHLMSRDHKGA